MALTREQARLVVEEVKKDGPCVQQIESFLNKVLPDRWRMTGNARNAGFMLKMALEDVGALMGAPQKLRWPFSSTYPDVAPFVCHGIAKGVAEVVQRGIGLGHLPDVQAASPWLRQIPVISNHKYLKWYATSHWATKVRMKDRSEYIFDYHQTLNVNNPVLYRLADWMGGLSAGGVEYDRFTGFDTAAAAGAAGPAAASK